MRRPPPTPPPPAKHSFRVSITATQIDDDSPGGPAYFLSHQHRIEAVLEKAVGALFEEQPVDPLDFLARYLSGSKQSTPTSSVTPAARRTRDQVLADMGNNVLDELRSKEALKELPAEEMDWRMELAEVAVHAAQLAPGAVTDDLGYAASAGAITTWHN